MQLSDSKTQDFAARALLIILLVPFIAGGLGLIYLGVWSFMRSGASSSWDVTEGEVVHSAVEKSRSDESICFKSHVVYQYTVAGRTLKNDVLRLGAASCDKQRAQEVVRRYPVGETVQVFWNPTEPTASCLETGYNWLNLLAIPFGLLFFGAGIAVGAQVFGKDKSEKEAKNKNPNLLYYDSQSSRGFFSGFLIFFVGFLTVGFTAFAFKTIYLAPVALFLMWCLWSVIYAWIKNEKWEAGIEDGTLWWRSPRLPKSQGTVALDQVARMEMTGNDVKARAYLEPDHRKIKIPFSGSTYKLRKVLEEHFDRIQIDWSDST